MPWEQLHTIATEIKINEQVEFFSNNKWHASLSNVNRWDEICVHLAHTRSERLCGDLATVNQIPEQVLHVHRQ